MKLNEILNNFISHIPKQTRFMTQDRDATVRFWNQMPVFRDGYWVHQSLFGPATLLHSINVGVRAEDWANSVVTVEEWEPIHLNGMERRIPEGSQQSSVFNVIGHKEQSLDSIVKRIREIDHLLETLPGERELLIEKLQQNGLNYIERKES